MTVLHWPTSGERWLWGFQKWLTDMQGRQDYVQLNLVSYEPKSNLNSAVRPGKANDIRFYSRPLYSEARFQSAKEEATGCGTGVFATKTCAKDLSGF